jgi:hypothetical protein
MVKRLTSMFAAEFSVAQGYCRAGNLVLLQASSKHHVDANPKIFLDDEALEGPLKARESFE